MDKNKTLKDISEAINQLEDIQKSTKELVNQLETLQQKMGQLESELSVDAFHVFAKKLLEGRSVK